VSTTGLGRAEATLTFFPPGPLTEGGHAFELTAFDTAGNSASRVVTFSIDESAPSLALDVPGTVHVASPDVTLSGATDPGATVTVGGTDVAVSATGQFSRTWTLPDGINHVDVTAVDWFDASATGDRLPGNPLTRSVTFVVDQLPPTINLLSGATVGPVADAEVGLLATIHDLIAPGVDTTSDDLTVTLNGAVAFLHADGRFEATVPLRSEGANTIVLVVTDPAGNSAMQTITALRDTTPPTLTLDDLDPTVNSGGLNLSGSSTGASLILVNGRILLPQTDGSFWFDLELSPGRNDLIIVAEDPAGNRATEFRSVEWVGTPARGISGLVAGIAIAIAVVAGLFLALLFFRPTPGTAEEAVPTVDDRMERLEKALKSGKIDQDTYERNAAKLRAERERGQLSAAMPADIPPPAEALPPMAVPAPPPEETTPEAPPEPAALKPAKPSFEDRVNRLEEAYRSGRIPKAAYEANLSKLRGEDGAPKPVPATKPVEVPPEDRPTEELAEEELPPAEAVQRAEPEPAPAEAPPDKPSAPAGEDRVAKLQTAFKEGRISKDAYAASLRNLGVAPKPPTAPSPDEKAAKLDEAYKAGRITKKSYEANLAKLGRTPPEDERITKLRKAFEEGRVSKEAYEANLKKLRGSA